MRISSPKEEKKPKRISSKTVASVGMLLGLTLALSMLESVLPPIALLPPGVKLGLANVTVMFCVFYFSGGTCFFLCAGKALFAFLTRGLTASVFSLCGGIVSVAVMLLLRKSAVNCSLSFISVCGACGHTAAQILLSAVLFQNMYLLYTLIPALPAAAGMGLFIALVARLTVRPVSRALRS